MKDDNKNNYLQVPYRVIDDREERAERERKAYEQMMKEREYLERRSRSWLLGNWNHWDYPVNPIQQLPVEPPKQKPLSIELEKVDQLKKAEPRKITQRVPDMTEVITGWRAWKIGNSSGLLEAIGMTGVWKPKKIMDAACQSSMTTYKHKAPHKNCQCGIWAFKTVDMLVQALNHGSYKVPIIGSVSLWGRVIETENGFRAQYGYPAELWMLEPDLEEFGMTYGVPVRTL